MVLHSRCIYPKSALDAEQILFDCWADGFPLVWSPSGQCRERMSNKMPTRKWKMTGSYLLHNDLHYNGLMTDWGLAFRCSYFVVVLEIWDDMLYWLSPWKKRWSVLRVSLWRFYKYIPCHCRKVRKKRGKATKSFRSFGNCYLKMTKYCDKGRFGGCTQEYIWGMKIVGQSPNVHLGGRVSVCFLSRMHTRVCVARAFPCELYFFAVTSVTWVELNGNN